MKVLSTLLSLRPAHTALLVVAALGASGLTLPAHATRIKEVAAIQGVRSNQLTGYGLVVGMKRHIPCYRCRFLAGVKHKAVRLDASHNLRFGAQLTGSSSLYASQKCARTSRLA